MSNSDKFVFVDNSVGESDDISSPDYLEIAARICEEFGLDIFSWNFYGLNLVKLKRWSRIKCLLLPGSFVIGRNLGDLYFFQNRQIFHICIYGSDLVDSFTALVEKLIAATGLQVELILETNDSRDKICSCGVSDY